jgi:hypothetical protein
LPTENKLNNLYIYPNDINPRIQPISIFEAYNWQVSGKRTLEVKPLKDVVGSIILPIPKNGLTNTTTQRWEEGEGLLLGAGFGALVQKGVASFKQFAGDVLKGGEFQKGITINDYASLHYSGADFREYTFEFSLIPKNEKEAENIVDIIRFFKRNSSPELTDVNKLGPLGTLGIKYPAFWKVQILFPSTAKSRMKNIVKFKDMVITGVADNLYPEGITTSLKSGQPIKIDISLNMRELEKMYKTDY